MKKLWVAAVTTAMFLGVQAYGEVKSVNVVGVMGLEIAGHPENDTFTLIAAPMTKLPVARGLIAGNTDDTIEADGASWAANTFAVGGDAADEPGDSTYYVEITSGAFEGRHFYISANSSDTLTLAAAMSDVNPGELAGAGFKIIPANRIRDIFGEPDGGQQLAGGSSPTTADIVRLMNPSGWTGAIYYKNGGFGLLNTWVQGSNDASDLVVDRDIGVLVLRRAGGDTVELSVTGEVSANAQAAVVVPGFSLAGGMSAVPVAIGNTTLTNVLQSGSSPTTADTIRSWTGSGWSGAVYYKDGGFGLVDTWVQGSQDVSESFIIEPGSAYLIRKAGSESGIWDRESPLVD